MNRDQYEVKKEIKTNDYSQLSSKKGKDIVGPLRGFTKKANQIFIATLNNQYLTPLNLISKSQRCVYLVVSVKE